ncbi:MAG: DUF3068 domain-containing protein [Nocardiopsis sp. BM-2018]|uniref:DUF3068 domain-containing protein n=1 Tax=Nocardiopsis metallicus TaxID=179819 RepID=A0A840WGK5_9ACTN|nr:DUF3068 domain-containing protein [Nocardiopsis metallicus]MBB5495392.1 hypothetical protein [Nocardiopsis metallicus]QRN79024.1 MAG: DUF3068 domain-containing protein [Nocardiopsis sp. BM-2018]
MRRTVAVVLIALGVFCLALAPMMRTWVSSSLMKTPLDYYNPTVNVGEVTYFNIEDVELVEDADVEAHSTIRADVASSSDDVVVWDQFTWIKDADTDFGISSTNRRAGHDRVTGELVDCCDAMINDQSVTQTGQGWKFPFFTEQRDYDFFETTVQENVPMVFEGVEEIDGVEAYKFVQTVEPTAIDERELPREVAGLEGEGDVVGDEMFSIVRTYWVEPVSGSPINISEEHHRAVVVDGEEVLTLLSGELKFDDATRAAAIENTAQARAVLPLLQTTLPIGALIVGVGLIGIAVVLLVTGRRPEHHD